MTANAKRGGAKSPVAKLERALAKAHGSQQLSAAALADLAKSGLNAQDARRLGITSAPTGGFGHTDNYRLPYFEPSGKVNGYYRDKLFDNPEAKYKQPLGTAPHVYLPPLLKQSWAEIQRDPTILVIITEGEKKAACGCKHGFATMGLGGVDSWRAKAKGLSLLPELVATEWKGRPTFIVFDNDPDPKPRERTRRAAEQLAAKLKGRGARIHIITLPGGA